MASPKAVFFDLDGTLADTARDLHAALNRLCEEEGRPPSSYEAFRPNVSQGSPAMLRLGFDCGPGDPDYERLRERLLLLYERDICSHTTLFPGVEQLITELEEGGYHWGIITNKPGWLTDKLLDRLDFGGNAVCIISGDTLARRKPDPDQLLHALESADCKPHQGIYVGDARSDIVAGRAAGMRTIAALFGYIPLHEDPHDWQADAAIDSPLELLDWLSAATFTGSRK